MTSRTMRLVPPLAAAVMLMAAVPAWSQQTVTVVAGQRYEADGLIRTIAGSGWRDLWTTPVRVPVLSLDTFAGGLTPERTGGRQSRTLHFQGGDGRLYIFRSVDKYLHGEALPEALRNAPLGDVVQDQISALMPAAGLVVGPLYDAAGLLHPWPTLVVMPDDERLGEFRDVFAGMIGQIEENPQEGPDDTPGFAGSSKLVGADKFLERLDETSEHRVDASEYLAARLIQFMIGDTDRGSDQWRFARFDNPAGEGLIWRPVARDHDFAFMRPTGLIGRASLKVYPKLARFDESFESLRALMFMTRDMDRRLLVELPRERWDSVVTALQTGLTDDVLHLALDRLPEEWQQYTDDILLRGLQSRRSNLHEIAAEFFAAVSHEADVHATNEAESAQIERLADGSVEVRLYASGSAPASIAALPAAAAGAPAGRGGAGTPYFQRRFMPGETREVRLYMLGGDDAVTVTGSAHNSIRVRVIAGRGDDVLVDSSAVTQGRWATTFYTAHGDDRVVRGPDTRVDPREFPEMLPGRPLDLMALAPDPDAPQDDEDDADGPDTASADPSDGAAGDDTDGNADNADESDTSNDVVERLLRPSFRDWGSKAGVEATADFRSGSGLLVGAAAEYTRYGFRRDRYKYYGEAVALYSLDTSRFGLELFGDYHPENTSLGFSVDAAATQFETFRFFGYGNDTEAPDNDISPRVFRDQITVRPAMYWADDTKYFGVGPVFSYGNPRFDDGSPISQLRPLGTGSFAQAGAAADLRLERGTHIDGDAHGYSIAVGASAYPEFLDVSSAFGRAHAVARAWVPLGWPFLALRAGGERVWGEFPVHEAAFVGGRNSLRGFETDRFAGDASLFGSTELHAPLGMIELLVHGELGVFGLADAGRVYVDGESPGGWHTSWGGGAWFSSLGGMLSLAYATGETGRFYLRLGMPL